jgi:HAD superfamily phosphoserine phosphatase-like hydrolase
MRATKPVILCDFDGTISTMDVADTIFTVYLGDRWDEIDQEWHDGNASMVELYEKCWELVDIGEKELVDFIDRIVGKENIPIFIVSDGFDFYIERIMSAHGVGGLKHYSNKLSFDDEGGMVLGFDNQNRECIQCANCKKFVMDERRAETDFVIYIGNGLSDRCAAEHADLVFAKDSLQEHCEKAGIEYVPYSSFDDICKYFADNGLL